MCHPPKPATRISCAKLIATLLACVAVVLAAPQMAWAQTGSATTQAKQSAEGDRLLNAGIKAYQQGQMAEASRLFEQARAIYSREHGEDHPDTLTSMNNLAVTYSDLGQNDKALALKEQALKLRRAKLGEDHPSTLASMNSLAVTYGALGQNDKSLALLEQALKLRRAKLGEDHPSTLDSMNNLALIYGILGQHDKALALKEQTLKLRRAKLGEDHSDTLTSMSNLALTYSDLGQHDKALVLHEQTLKLRRAKLGEDHPSTLASMQNLANTYSRLGQHDKALVLHEQTLKLIRAKLGENHPDTLGSMHNLAAAYMYLGQHDKALVLNEQILKLRRTKLGEDHPATLNSMHNLAATYINLGQHDKALVLNEQALKLSRAKLGEDHPDTLRSMNNLAVTYSDLGQNDKALALIPGIVSGAEKLRALPGLATEQRQSIFAKYSDDYQLYAKWYASARRTSDAFNLGDISKARTLIDSIKAQAALRSLPMAEQQKLQASESRAQTLQANIDKFSAQGTRDSGAVLALQKQLDAHNADHLQLLAGLNSRFPKYAQITHIKAALASQARQLLSSGEVFVSYLVTTTGMAQAFVLDASGEAQWVDLGQIHDHDKVVAAYRDLVAPSAGDAPPHLVILKSGRFKWMAARQALPEGARIVSIDLKWFNRYWHETLIKPILPLAGSYKRWIISPDKDLALLPFDTLVEVFDAAGEPAQTMVQTRNITLVQSFAVFALLKQREAEYATLKRPKELFAMGNAVYGDGWAENRGIRRGGGKRGFAVRSGAGNYSPAPLPESAERSAMNGLSWENLPGTAHEIQAVSAVFSGTAKGDGANVDSHLGPEASEGKLLQLNAAGKLKEYRYLLFSAHGYLAKNPALSSLVLSQQGNPPEIDGYVTAGEWPLYDVRSDLTVLSACDTGVGRTQAGEGVMGLPYALFVAGNKNTLLSLWPVDDEATAEFMRRFFTKIKAGTSQPDALRQTKQEFMQHPDFSEPKFWAAFVLYGV
jgi:tetratricopeptide (TPR) repeat protein